MSEEWGDPAHNLPEFTVSELSGALKRTVEDSYGYVRVRGEISAPKVAASGHCYLRLKDENAVLDGVIWRGTMSKLSLDPEEGLDVIASGRLTTYPGRSSYQIIIDSMDVAGEGALLKMLEERKKRLEAEGLFATERKQDIPFLPEVIGVVTSPTGAVIRDILHRLADRFPRHVLLWPVRVQGEGAKDEITAAIEGFNAIPAGGDVPLPDVLIVARGGGSLEDLWAFNEENVVRAAAASDIPLISAVGHETDTTLIDFVSDQRAPTPTAAAEMAVPVRLDLLAQVRDDAGRLVHSVRRLVDDRQVRLEGLARGLPDLESLLAQRTQDLDGITGRLATAPQKLYRQKAQELKLAASGLRLDHLSKDVARSEERITELMDRASQAIETSRSRAQDRLEGLAARLESVSPARVLERGYVMVSDRAGAPVTSLGQVSEGDGVTLTFKDGATDAVIGATDTSAPTKAKKPPQSKSKKSPSKTDDRQGSLL